LRPNACSPRNPDGGRAGDSLASHGIARHGSHTARFAHGMAHGTQYGTRHDSRQRHKARQSQLRAFMQRVGARASWADCRAERMYQLCVSCITDVCNSVLSIPYCCQNL
jgi:hypothetical protein